MNKKYEFNTEENRIFLKENVVRLLDFGRHFPSAGGSSYYLGDDGTPWTDRSRETWITSRMAHVYSLGKMLAKSDDFSNTDEREKRSAEYGELAAAAIKGLRGELRDDENGGWYAGITSDGKILPGKACYAHAFVILAATSGLLAEVPGAKELLDEALQIYDKYFWNEEEGLSCDSWNTEFTVMDSYRGLNANMHTVEAFLAVADTFDILDKINDNVKANANDNINGNTYRIRAGRIIERVIGWAAENHYRIPEHFDEGWNPLLDLNIDKKDDPFKPYGATPGHGIEWARLIVQWAASSEDIDKEYYYDISCRLFERAASDAWFCDGAAGIVYTTDWDGKPVVHDRMHWTLAEAINTSAVLYKITGKKIYTDYYSAFMEYLDLKVIDHDKGSWFHQLDRDNKLKETVWPGKSDLYHAFQAMLIPYGRVEMSIAAFIKERNFLSTGVKKNPEK